MEHTPARDPLTRASGPIIAWLLVLLALTVLGALPLLLQGLNLNSLSATTPHIPLIMTGMLVTSCAPTLAALLVAGFYPEAGGIRSITRQMRSWRAPLRWYAVAILGPFLLLFAAETFNSWLSGRLPAHWMTAPSFSQAGGLYWVIFGSLLAEEPGWRGFAQPRLQARYGALPASILIGLLWSTWHLWYVILPGGLSSITATDGVATYLRLTATSIIYAWLYNSTGGSLLIAMLAHLGHNFAAAFMPTPADGGRQHFIVAVGYLLVATLVAVLTDRRTLGRRLGAASSSNRSST
ncbi:MAG TPA: CPBP family intramembrane glutamic endopeptidase [Steroidobacteraceae bacterium]|nr:CPBP family intramembrane glutamic endopeptidase [Steroidobacteraceae bacterium]